MNESAQRRLAAIESKVISKPKQYCRFHGWQGCGIRWNREEWGEDGDGGGMRAGSQGNRGYRGFVRSWQLRHVWEGLLAKVKFYL